MNKITDTARSKKRYAKVDGIPTELLEYIPCSLCGSKNYTKLYPHYYPRLVQCQACGLIYTNPRMKKSGLKKLYTKTYFQNTNSSVYGYDNYLADEVKIRKTAQRRLNKIEKFKSPGKLLDLGCATGFFLDEARKNGWKVSGVEISAFAANYAQEKLKLPVQNKDLFAAHFKPKSFDVITMWDVIEHIPQPAKTVQKLTSYLKDDGLLVFATPDVGSLPARLTKYRWIGYKLSDEHLSYFSLETLTELLKKADMEIAHHHPVGKHVSFELFSNRVGIYNEFLGATLSKLNNVIPKDFSFYMSAFDIICVYAKKKKKRILK